MKIIRIYLNTAFYNGKNLNLLEICVSQWKETKFILTLYFAIYLSTLFHNEKNPNLLEHSVLPEKESKFTWTLCFPMKRIWIYLNNVFHIEEKSDYD